MTQAGAFGQVSIGDATNTLVDITANVQDIDTPLIRLATDVTTFSAGGNPATRNIIEGAIQSTITMTLIYDPTIWVLLFQIWGARSGSLIQHMAGKNALPTLGDTVFRGTYTLFTIIPTYTPGQTAKLACTFMITDGGATVPGWGSY